MPRPRNAVPARKIHISLPGDIGTRLDLLLYSVSEQRIPFAAHQRFILARILEFFNWRRLDLAAYIPNMEADSTVSGDPATIERLKKALEKK